jgi:hypothetical protein
MDQKKLKLLQEALKEKKSKKKSFFNKFIKENKDSVIYFMELLLKTNNSFLTSYINFESLPVGSTNEEESFFQRSFEKIITKPEQEVSELFVVFENNFTTYNSQCILPKILLNVFESSKNKPIQNMEKLVECITMLENIEGIGELIIFIVFQLEIKHNWFQADLILTRTDEIFLKLEESTFQSTYQSIKKEIFEKKIPICSGLISFIEANLEQFSKQEMVQYVELFEPILKDYESMKKFSLEISSFFEKIVGLIEDREIISQILTTCLSQLMIVNRKYDEDLMEDDDLSEDEDFQHPIYSYVHIFTIIVEGDNSWFDTTIIPWIKKLLKNKKQQSNCVDLLTTLELNELEDREKIFEKFQKAGVLHLLLQLLKNSKDSDFKFEILIFFIGNCRLLKNMGMCEDIIDISKELYAVGKTHYREPEWIESLTGMLVFSNEFNFKLGVKPQDWLPFVAPMIKDDESLLESDNFKVIQEIFSGEQINLTNYVKDTIKSILHVITNTPNHDFIAESYAALQAIFLNLKLDTRPWFVQTITTCISALQEIMKNIHEIENGQHLSSVLVMIFTLIRIYGEEVEKFVGKSKIILILVHLLEV